MNFSISAYNDYPQLIYFNNYNLFKKMNPNKNKNIDEKYNGSCLFNYLFIKCQTILKNGSCFIISHFMPIYQSDNYLVKTHGYIL